MEKEFIHYSRHDVPINVQKIILTSTSKLLGLHSHAAVEIIAVHKGKLTCYINGDTVEIKEKEIVLININVGHRLTSQNAEITYVQIDISNYKDVDYENKGAAIYDFILLSHSKPYMFLSSNEEIEKILNKIVKQYENQLELSKWYLTAYIYELIAFMYSVSFISPYPKNLNIQRIATIVRFLDANFKSALGLNAISTATGYNKYTLCHIFKEITGKTIFDYINFLRIRDAINKLKQTDKNILEIATESGFSSAAYFNRVFKNKIGCTPLMYRKIFLSKTEK